MKSSEAFTYRMIPIARPVLGTEEFAAVKEVMESGIVVQGPKVEAFEKKFAAYTGVRHAVAVNSGTSALHLALLAFGVKNGQDIVMPSVTFFATASTALMCGARPVFTDIEEGTYTLDPEHAKKGLTSKTSVLMPVHLYGQMADMDHLLEIARKKDIKVIEDAAQAHGAEYHGRKSGSMGDAACFSFYATKTMTTCEGGMITTNDDEIADKCRLLRDHGQISKYQHDLLGYNYRMTELAGAIGLVQLGKLDTFIELRRRNASLLTVELKEVETVITPFEAPNRLHTYYQYILRLGEDYSTTRKELISLLEEKRVASRPSYPMPLYQQKALVGKSKSQKCKVAETVLPRLIELPVHPLVPRGVLDTAVEVIKGAA